jgi:hypothetical protein|tara:strand:- start:1922 stop:2056 length:135 start_codon:yes stop_codon:yes gene_type:complete
VHENRVDLDLERNGNVLTQGRDEQQILVHKRENDQANMKKALQE